MKTAIYAQKEIHLSPTDQVPLRKALASWVTWPGLSFLRSGRACVLGLLGLFKQPQKDLGQQYRMFLKAIIDCITHLADLTLYRTRIPHPYVCEDGFLRP
jgi:hypothetical protein